jgi:hypothetical protein
MRRSFADLPRREPQCGLCVMIIVDEILGGSKRHVFDLEFLEEVLTVREIIRARIWQEVHEYNARQRMVAFTGLIQPSDPERRLNGDKTKAFVPINWESQYEAALRGFESNGYFIIVGERQAESLDETFRTGPETEVSFVKITPLVGG